MSNLQIIEEMCGILEDMARVIEGQQKVLAQHDAAAMAEEYGAVKKRYTDLLGRDEWPDNTPGQEGE